MNKYFHYFNLSCDEWTSSVNFAYDSTSIYLSELLLFELQQIAYYIVKLDSLGMDVSKKKEKVIDFISLVVSNLYLKGENFEIIVDDLEANKDNLAAQYKNICLEKDVSAELLSENEIFGCQKQQFRELNISERRDYLKEFVYNSEKRPFYEIAMKLVQSVCIILTELKKYGAKLNGERDAVLKMLAKCNFINDTYENWKKNIFEFSEVNYKLNLHLNSVLNERYGAVRVCEVSTNPSEGKCILVTGHFYKDLENLLEATKGLDINIYTHSDMLMAHAYEKFSFYPHLKGHYQKSYDNIQLDFASFPGPILITSHSIPQAEIIRGQIYTMDNFSVFGLTRIENNDFTPIIKYAQNSQGFKKNFPKSEICVGYNVKKVENKLNELREKVKNGEIRHLFILGGLDRFQGQDNYFKNFMNKCPSDCFVISFSYMYEKENFLHINSHYDFQLLWGILDKFNKEYRLENYPVSVFITRCNSRVISTIFNLKILGIKNIYLPSCFPNVLNPSLVKGLKEYFDIRIISGDASEDIEKILSEKN